MEAAGKRYIVHGSRGTEIKIWNIADIHWMSKACAEGKVREDLATIRDDPYSFWVGGGDYCDFIGYSDKRWDPDAVADWVSVSDLGQLGRIGTAAIRDLFKPIRHKCLGLLLGNHEKHYQKANQQEDLHAWLCTELDVPNLQYSAFVKLSFQHASRISKPRLQAEPCNRDAGSPRVAEILMFCHHGAGYAQTPGGKINRLIAFMDRFDADLYFCAHVHDRLGRRKVKLSVDAKCTEIIQRVQLGIITGSYLKTYAKGVTTYGEQRGYEPVSIGAAWVSIRPETREMRAEI